MARILFTSNPMAGHIRPGLAVAHELVAAGHEVLWYTGRKYQPLVTAAGARFSPFPERLDWDDAALLNPVGAGTAAPVIRSAPGTRVGPWRGIRILEQAIIDLFLTPLPAHAAQVTRLVDAFQPDVLMTEQGFMAAPAVGELRGIPRVIYTVSPLNFSSVDTAPFWLGLAPWSGPLGRLRNRTLNWADRRIFFARAQQAARQVRQALGLPPLAGYFMDWLVDMADRIVHGSIPELEYPRRDLPAKVEFVGLMLPTGMDDWTPPRWWSEVRRARREGRPVVVVTQGTLVTNPDNLIRPAISALAGEDVLVVATTAGHDPAVVIPPRQRPANLRIERFVPFTELVPQVDLLVTNGGFGGVQTALSYGVPVIGAGTTEDKAEVNGRVARAGAGLALRTNTPSPAQIRSAVRTVLGDPAYRAQAQRLQASYARYGGASRAAQVVLEAAPAGIARP